MPRIFFALWPDDDVRDQVRAYQHELNKKHCKFVKPRNFHITLSFLGQVEEDKLEALLALPFEETTEHFSLKLDTPGWWKRPKVIWLAPEDYPMGLPVLVDSINGAVTGLGLTVDERPYQPHLTLARKAKRKPKLPVPEPIHWNIKDFSLVVSESEEGGSMYRVLKNWPLS